MIMEIVIIDDDPIVSQALRTIIQTDPDVTVAAIGDDGEKALLLYRKHLPDILLMDIRMRKVSGLEAAEQVLSIFPDAKILFLTTFSDDEYIVKALNLGAKGYLLKQNFDSILPALRVVQSGQSVFGEDVLSNLSLTQARQETVPDLSSYGLTKREESILLLISEGLSNKEIAEKQYISEGTVRNSISLLLEKLQLRSRTQLAIFYLKMRMQ